MRTGACRRNDTVAHAAAAMDAAHVEAFGSVGLGSSPSSKCPPGNKILKQPETHLGPFYRPLP